MTYGRVTKVTFGDGLEECGFPDVRKADLNIISFLRGEGQSSIRFHSSSYYQACPAGSSPPLPLSWEASSFLRSFE
jgi:hypothetical protein